MAIVRRNCEMSTKIMDNLHVQKYSQEKKYITRKTTHCDSQCFCISLMQTVYSIECRDSCFAALETKSIKSTQWLRVERFICNYKHRIRNTWQCSSKYEVEVEPSCRCFSSQATTILSALNCNWLRRFVFFLFFLFLMIFVCNNLLEIICKLVFKQ